MKVLKKILIIFIFSIFSFSQTVEKIQTMKIVEKKLENGVLKETIKEAKVVVPVKIKRTVILYTDNLFKFDKSSLKDLLPDAEGILKKEFEFLNETNFKIEKVSITGHTDNIGDEKYNYNLALKRANTLKAYLKKLGVKINISVNSKGESEPIIYCVGNKLNDELKKCLQPNRRVIIEVEGYRDIN